MKAFVMHEIGRTGFMDKPVPKPGPNDAVVRTTRALICTSDLLGSFWLVDNLALQGRIDEASLLYASLCAKANSVGLLSEQIDPSTGSLIGNFPQAFSHLGVVASGVNLARANGGTSE
jgi:hypothetical protein